MTVFDMDKKYFFLSLLFSLIVLLSLSPSLLFVSLSLIGKRHFFFLLFAQQIISNIYLLVNSLFGPFILSMSILPGYEGGFKNWFSRYFQLSMWVPTGYMVMGLNLHISNYFVELASKGGAGLSLEWTMIVMQVLALVSITAVPKFVTWIAHATGSDDAHGSISQMAKKAIKL